MAMVDEAGETCRFCGKYFPWLQYFEHVARERETKRWALLSKWRASPVLHCVSEAKADESVRDRDTVLPVDSEMSLTEKSASGSDVMQWHSITKAETKAAAQTQKLDMATLDLFTSAAIISTDKPSEILPGFLYLGALGTAKDSDFLSGRRIGFVLNMIGPKSVNAELKQMYEILGIKCKCFAADDSSSFDIGQHISDTTSFIDEVSECKGRILVHCAAGVSRSATIVIAYLIKHGKTLQEAMMHVRACRPIVYPNRGFLAFLMRYEKETHGKHSIPPEAIELHEQEE